MKTTEAGNNWRATDLESGAGRSPDAAAPPRTKGGGRAMNVLEFFEYLAANEQTEHLAHELADVWVSRQLAEFVTAA